MVGLLPSKQKARVRFSHPAPHNMTLDQVNTLTNSQLVDLYAESVRIGHYDPFATPQIVIDLRKNGITTDVLEQIILDRMQ